MSLVKYKYIDLTFLLFVGVITEVVGCYLINLFLPSVVPVFVATFAVIYVAIIRWGKIGLILVPVLSLVTYLCATYVIPNKILADGYTQLKQNYLTIIMFNAGAVLTLVFKKHKNFFDGFGKRLLMYLAIYCLGIILCGLTQLIYGNNLFMSLLRLFIEQFMSFFVTVVALEILRNQGVLEDVFEKTLIKKDEEKFEKDYYEIKK